MVNIFDKESRIDIFDPEGFFISEFKDPAGAQSIAVDSEGNMYLFERVQGGERQVHRYPATVYKPMEGKIEYGAAPVLLLNESTKELISLGPETSLDVDRVTGRVYVDNGRTVSVFGSAAEENKLLEKEVIDLTSSFSIAIDAAHGKIYASDVNAKSTSIVRIFKLGSPYEELGVIDGSTTPKGQFVGLEGKLSIDIDDGSGHVFVGNFIVGKVYEFGEDGSYIATIEHSFEEVANAEIAVDDGAFSPHPQKEAWLFVPSNPWPSLGHVYAFEPKEQCAPVVESAATSGVTRTEAVLHAQINPCGLATEYRFEYITQQQFKEEGESFVGATVAGEGTLPKGAEGVAVSAAAAGLQPGTAYRFRAIAANEEGKGEEESTFTTFPPEEVEPCVNEALRTGLSAALPDCRAYELVTPPDTNGRPPTGGFGGIFFPALQASPDGNRASYYIEGGTIPGSEGAGVGDLFLATRGSEGWFSALAGPTGADSPSPVPGSVSPDQGYSFWGGNAAGVFIRYPDGHSELVGKGSLGEDLQVSARLITEAADHIVFAGSKKLEPNAAPEGTKSVYDRSAEGPTHVVSLLPNDEPQQAGEDATYLGASEDGEGIVFEIKGTIYLRLRNAETFEVAGPGAEFAGVVKEGTRVFYMEGGNLFAFDAEAGSAGEVIEFSTSGDVIPVNVASGGIRAYFVSPSVLTGELNPNGEEAEAGQENLYLSEEGTISFVGIVTKRDVEGELTGGFGEIGGLGLWDLALEKGAPGKDPSRTTPAGTTLLFESRANLTDFNSKGFAQVYRYDVTEGRLDCLSCSPTEAVPPSDASLQTVGVIEDSHVKIPNQSPDGRRAFFQTAAQLVIGDTDGQLDVYEWEENGVGGCKKPNGCTYLISGPHSASPDYLFAMSASGDDVFFRTADLLLPRDAESTQSLYDARVDGGFPESSPICREACCEGDACRPLESAPELPRPTTTANVPGGNVPPEGKCPKGKHAVKRHGRTICVKKKHRTHRHHRHGSAKRGGAK